MRMRKIAMISFVVAILGLVPAAMAQISSGECVELITDGGDEFTATDIGEVCVSNDGETLTVIYTVDGDPSWWSMLLTTHLHVWSDDDDGPKLVGGGNTVPGKFAWQVPDEETATSATFHIPLVGNYPGKGKKAGDAYDWTGDEIYIAAHSVVGNGLCDCELLLEALPDTLGEEVTVGITYAHNFSGIMDGYFEVVISGDGILDGTYPGWCGDPDLDYDPSPAPGTQVFSSLCEDVEDIPEGLILHPENLDLVNWVLNNKEGYTIGDVQYVIWMLIGGGLPTDPETMKSIISYDPPNGYLIDDQGYDQDRVDQLLADAIANGEGFVPSCDEVMAVIIVPPAISAEELVQSVLIEVPAPCCETAWGGTAVELGGDDDSDENGWGIDFPGSDWSMYFTYQVGLPDLVVSDITPDSTTVTQGTILPYTYTVANIGAEGPASNPTFDVATYLSTDDVLDGGDTELGQGYSAWTYHLSVGWSQSQAEDDVVISAAPGSYYLIVVADAKPGEAPNYYPGVVESDETNNARAVAITVVAPAIP